MPDDDKIKKVRDQIFGYAPYPETGEVNPVGLARHLAVSALVRRVRLDCTPVSATGMHARYTETDAVCADLAGAVALWALAATRATPEPDPEGPRGWPLIPKAIEGKSPSIVATMIRDIWDSGELGEWLWELLGKDVAEDVSALVTQLAKLAAEGQGEDEPVIDGTHTLLGYLNSKGSDWADAIDDGAMGWFGWSVEGDRLTVKWEPQDPESGGPGPAVTRSWRLVPAEAVSAK